MRTTISVILCFLAFDENLGMMLIKTCFVKVHESLCRASIIYNNKMVIPAYDAPLSLKPERVLIIPPAEYKNPMSCYKKYARRTRCRNDLHRIQPYPFTSPFPSVFPTPEHRIPDINAHVCFGQSLGMIWSSVDLGSGHVPDVTLARRQRHMMYLVHSYTYWQN